MVIKKYEKLFENLRQFEPPAGLYERIILAIKREQGRQKRKKLLFGFLSLLIISFITMPFSWKLLLGEIRSSGILYFISTAVSDFGVFLLLWQDFSLAILESLPIAAMGVFTINVTFFLFTLHLFLCRKKIITGLFIP